MCGCSVTGTQEQCMSHPQHKQLACSLRHISRLSTEDTGTWHVDVRKH